MANMVTHVLIMQPGLDLTFQLQDKLHKVQQTAIVSQWPKDECVMEHILNTFNCEAITMLVESKETASAKNIQGMHCKLTNWGKQKGITVHELLVLNEDTLPSVLRILSKSNRKDSAVGSMSGGSLLSESNKDSDPHKSLAEPDSGLNSSAPEREDPNHQIDRFLNENTDEGLIKAAQVLRKCLEECKDTVRNSRTTNDKLKHVREFRLTVLYFQCRLNSGGNFNMETLDKLNDEECAQLVQLRLQKEAREDESIKHSQAFAEVLHQLSMNLPTEAPEAFGESRLAMIDIVRQMGQNVQRLQRQLESQDAMTDASAEPVFQTL